jgi:hypothetical protein
MLPLYAARIEDLGPGDFVKVDCAACHHVALLSAEALMRVGLSPGAKVLDLKGRLRCRAAGERGGRWFRSGGAGRTLDPTTAGACAGGGLKERRRVGGSSRRRSLLGLVRPDHDRQAMRSYAPVVNEVSVVEFCPALRVNGRG